MTTKREPQCTTYAQLHEHMAHVYKMCEEMNVAVFACVRKNGRKNGTPCSMITGHPVLDGEPIEFEFALGVVECIPVFRGDVLWFDGEQFVANESTMQNKHAWAAYSWNSPRRTINIGDVEVPAPKEVRYHSAFSNTIELEFLSHDDAFIAKAALEGNKP